MKKQSLIKGSIILGAAGIIAKFLGLFFRWPLILLIGDEGIGYYQLSYPLYMFFVSEDFGTYKWEQRCRSCGILFDRKRVLELVPDNIKDINPVLFDDIKIWVTATMDYIKNEH